EGIRATSSDGRAVPTPNWGAALMVPAPSRRHAGPMLSPAPELPQLAVLQQPEPAVELLDVTKRYGRRRGTVTALDRVSATFPRGTLTVVMGLSGSGKSTLLQCAAGLDRPTSGTVHLAGLDLSRLNRRRLSVLRRQRVGFVFQSLNLVPTLS